MKSERERQIPYAVTYRWNPIKNDTKELIYKTETDSRFQNQSCGYCKLHCLGGEGEIVRVGKAYTHYGIKQMINETC